MKKILIVVVLVACGSVASFAQTEDSHSLKRPIHCTSTASIPSIITCYDINGNVIAAGEAETRIDDRLLARTKPASRAAAIVTAQAPTKLFDVGNGNGAVIGGNTVTRGTIIWYRDDAAKNKVIDNFCAAYGYQDVVPNPNAGQPGEPDTIPNPQGKQAFFNKQVSNYIRDIVRSQAIKVASETAAKTAADAEDADLPTRTIKP